MLPNTPQSPGTVSVTTTVSVPALASVTEYQSSSPAGLTWAVTMVPAGAAFAVLQALFGSVSVALASSLTSSV